MGVGGSSPAAGSSCANCLRKFTVHFRRALSYKGEFGFDWIRDEYRYDQKYDAYDDNDKKTTKLGPYYLNNFNELAKKYHSPKGALSPFGVTYYPAWLSLFTKPKKGNENSSIINDKGVNLMLEVEQMYFDSKEPLVDDGTSIEFIASNKNIVLSVTKVPLTQLINNRNILHLKKDGYKVNKISYSSKTSINISCKDSLHKYEYVDIYARKGTAYENVGRLVIYPNVKIPKVEIVLVDVIWGGIKKFTKPKNLDYHLKFTSLNQALIRAEVVADTTFKLDDPKIIKNQDVQGFLRKCGGMTADEIKASIINLYDKYGNRKPIVNGKTLNLETDGHNRTFIFFIGLSAGNILGLASSEEKKIHDRVSCFFKNESNVAKRWGNSAIIYNSAIQYPVNDKKTGEIKYLHTVIHELCHTLGLPHTFSESAGFNRLSKHKFVQGYIDNIMDYPHNKKDYTNKFILNNNILTLFKWQWDIVRKDRSVS